MSSSGRRTPFLIVLVRANGLLTGAFGATFWEEERRFETKKVALVIPATKSTTIRARRYRVRTISFKHFVD